MTALETLRRIVQSHHYDTIQGLKVDVVTATALLMVHDGLSVQNRAKFESMLRTRAGLLKLVDFTWERVRAAS